MDLLYTYYAIFAAMHWSLLELNGPIVHILCNLEEKKKGTRSISRFFSPSTFFNIYIVILVQYLSREFKARLDFFGANIR